MVVPLFWIYLVVELAAVVGLASTVGLGWTLLIVVATFFAGLAIAGSQIKRQFRRLREGMNTPHGTVTDGALVALGTVLVVIPGLVTSALGLLLLLPPTRAAARPLVTLLAARRAPFLTVASAGASRYAARRDYIDGEVIDVTDVEPPALPPSAE